MTWTPNQINSHFHDDHAFEANYCCPHTLETLRVDINPANLEPARLIAKRLAQLMPNGAHRSPNYHFAPCPWVIVSMFTGKAGMFGSSRVALFQSDNHFFLGLRCSHEAVDVIGLTFPPEVQGILMQEQYDWIRFNQENDHLCIQTAMPEDGQFLNNHPLAEGQPLALALEWINANMIVPTEVAHPEWYENFLIARGQPPDGVITPRVMSYGPGDHPGVQLPG